MIRVKGFLDSRQQQQNHIHCSFMESRFIVITLLHEFECERLYIMNHPVCKKKQNHPLRRHQHQKPYRIRRFPLGLWYILIG